MKRLSPLLLLRKLPAQIPSRDQIRRYAEFTWHHLQVWFARERRPALVCLAGGFIIFSLIHWGGVGVVTEKIWVNVEWDSVKERGTVPWMSSGDSVGSTVLRTDPQKIEVTIRGPRGAISEFFTREEHKRVFVRIRPRLPDGNSLTDTISLSRFDVKGISERSIRVVNIAPRKVEVTFDREIRMAFPFEGPALIETNASFRAVATPETSEVWLTGASSILNSLQGRRDLLRADPISLVGRTKDFTETVAVRPINEESLLRQGILRKPERDDHGIRVTTITVHVKVEPIHGADDGKHVPVSRKTEEAPVTTVSDSTGKTDPTPPPDESTTKQEAKQEAETPSNKMDSEASPDESTKDGTTEENPKTDSASPSP